MFLGFITPGIAICFTVKKIRKENQSLKEKWWVNKEVGFSCFCLKTPSYQANLCVN